MKQKPYIARDTGEPLEILGGYQVAADGGLMRRTLPRKIVKPMATEADLDLLEERGYAYLKEKQMFGVLDRLKNTEKEIIGDWGGSDWRKTPMAAKLDRMREFTEEKSA